MPQLNRRVTLAAVSAVVLACSVPMATAQAQTPVRFTLDWRFEGPSAPFVVALDKGYFKAEGLDVTIDAGNGSREVVQRVASGTYDMGLGDVNALIRFRDENPTVDVKAVMMVYDRPPFAIIGRKSRGVTADIASLEGKRFGAPAADAAFAQWPIFKAINGIDDSTMTMENVGFPVREPMLASGEVDAVFGFSMSTFITLKSRGVAIDDVVVLLMSDYGVELYGNVIMVSPGFAAANPEAVRGFLRAFMKGLKDAIASPEAAIDSVLKRNDIARKDIEVERLRMVLDQNMMTPWVKANGYGGIDRARFGRALDQLGLASGYRRKPVAEEIFTDAFLPADGDRKVM